MRHFLYGFGCRGERRGILLVVVLVIIASLTLVAGSFAYLMQADLASVSAMQTRQQARLAAESGVSRAILLLRDQRYDMDNWYDNPEAFRRILVWAPGEVGGSESLADQEEVEGRPAWRFSIVSNEIEGEKTRIRYGLTDESGKLNLLVATRGQLLALFDQFEFEDVSSTELADALIDWRDDDDEPNSADGAESSYYMTMEPRYRAKNRAFQTVDELLMVRGFTGQVLYGEDYNRNGYLDENEDDGLDGVFPPDDGDGILDRGLLPFVTVRSSSTNQSLDNKWRIGINAVKFSNAENLPEHIVEEISPEVIEFIAEAQSRGFKFRSIGELVGLEVFEDGSSNYDEVWEEYEEAVALSNKVTEEDEDEFEDEMDEGETGDSSEAEGSGEGDEGGDGTGGVADSTGDGSAEDGASSEDDGSDKSDALKKTDGEGGAEGEGGGDTGGKAKSPGVAVASPVTADQLDVLMDRLTVAQVPTQVGLINPNTALPEVLATIPGLTEEEAKAIVERRGQVSGEDKMTPAWLVSFGVLEPAKFAVVCNSLTTRPMQYSMDVVGFADHIGAIQRIQVMVEMQGQLAQIKYYRDIGSLGLGYPLTEDERSEGFEFDDR